jgi:hypothetical protein
VYILYFFRYDIIYKQAVTSEDMFLGMGNKNPATASCEDMVVSITCLSNPSRGGEGEIKIQQYPAMKI